MATVKEGAVNNRKSSGLRIPLATGGKRWTKPPERSHADPLSGRPSRRNQFPLSLLIHQDDERKTGSDNALSHCPILSSFLSLQLKICARYFAAERFHQ